MNISATIAKSIRWLPVALALAALTACGAGGGESSNGILGVSLTDEPACGFDKVNVTVSKFRVHMNAAAPDTSAGWSEVTLNPPQKINLLDLTNGKVFNLGETPLPAGHYSQMRLVLAPNTGSTAPFSNSVLPTGGSEKMLITPSAVQSGIKINNPFTVTSGQRSDFVLDFDACKSVVRNGNGDYLLKPVVNIVPNTANGINGFVPPALLNIGKNVLVTAQLKGTVVDSTVPDVLTGEFFLARLAPDTYDVVVSADDHATAVITGVPVTSSTSVVTL